MKNETCPYCESTLTVHFGSAEDGLDTHHNCKACGNQFHVLTELGKKKQAEHYSKAAPGKIPLDVLVMLPITGDDRCGYCGSEKISYQLENGVVRSYSCPDCKAHATRMETPKGTGWMLTEIESLQSFVSALNPKFDPQSGLAGGSPFNSEEIFPMQLVVTEIEFCEKYMIPNYTKAKEKAMTTSMIHKQTLPDPGVQMTMLFPKGAVLRKIARQNGIPHVWYEFDVQEEYNQENRRIAVYGTGQQIPTYKRYLGTYFEGEFNEMVWHVYELDQ